MNTTDTRSLEKQAYAAAQPFIGKFAWPTVVFGLFVIGCYISTLFAVWNGKISLVLAYLIATLATYSIYTVLHDSVHGSINGQNKSYRWLNDALGYLSGQIMFVSFKAHRLEHFTHHRYTNNAEKDPDMYVKSDSLWSLIRGTLVVLPLQYQFFFSERAKNVSAKDKTIVLIELVVMFSWRLAFLAFGLWQEALVLFVLGTFSGVFMLVILFVWLVHRPNSETARYKNTNTLIFPKLINTPVTWLWLHQNYHSIHHLYPSVPFYHYKALFNQIEHIMIANDAPIVRVGQRDVTSA